MKAMLDGRPAKPPTRAPTPGELLKTGQICMASQMCCAHPICALGSGR